MIHYGHTFISYKGEVIMLASVVVNDLVGTNLTIFEGEKTTEDNSVYAKNQKLLGLYKW